MEKEVVNPPHRFATTETSTALSQLIDTSHFVSVQGPVNDHYE